MTAPTGEHWNSKVLQCKSLHDTTVLLDSCIFLRDWGKRGHCGIAHDYLQAFLFLALPSSVWSRLLSADFGLTQPLFFERAPSLWLTANRMMVNVIRAKVLRSESLLAVHTELLRLSILVCCLKERGIHWIIEYSLKKRWRGGSGETLSLSLQWPERRLWHGGGQPLLPGTVIGWYGEVQVGY